MALHRGVYMTFMILYLVTLAVGLWFLFYYSQVPNWVWIFFGVAILLEIIDLLIAESSVTKTKKHNENIEHLDQDGTVVHVTSDDIIITDNTPIKMGGWDILYGSIQIVILILLIIGFAFVIKYAVNIPWWVWFLLGLSILFSILGTVIEVLTKKSKGLWLLICSIISTALWITGIIFFVIYTTAPWWTWAIIALAFIFAALAQIFHGSSIVGEENERKMKQQQYEHIYGTSSPEREEYEEYNVSLLPAEDIDEQTVEGEVEFPVIPGGDVETE